MQRLLCNAWPPIKLQAGIHNMDRRLPACGGNTAQTWCGTQPDRATTPWPQPAARKQHVPQNGDAVSL